MKHHSWLDRLYAKFSHNDMLWFQELNDMAELFPDVAGNLSDEPRDHLKDSYARLYTKVHQQQAEQFNLVASQYDRWTSTATERQHSELMQDYEHLKQEFTHASIVKRKSLLKELEKKLT